MSEWIDYYTATEANKVLELSGGRIRQTLLAGEIEGAVRDESGRWHIPRHAVHTMLEQRQQGEPQGVHQSKDVEGGAPKSSAKALVKAVKS